MDAKVQLAQLVEIAIAEVTAGRDFRLRTPPIARLARDLTLELQAELPASGTRDVMACIERVRDEGALEEILFTHKLPQLPLQSCSVTACAGLFALLEDLASRTTNEDVRRTALVACSAWFSQLALHMTRGERTSWHLSASGAVENDLRPLDELERLAASTEAEPDIAAALLSIANSDPALDGQASLAADLAALAARAEAHVNPHHTVRLDGRDLVVDGCVQRSLQGAMLAIAEHVLASHPEPAPYSELHAAVQKRRGTKTPSSQSQTRAVIARLTAEVPCFIKVDLTPPRERSRKGVALAEGFTPHQV